MNAGADDGETARQGDGATNRRGDLLKLTLADKVVFAYLALIALLILIFSSRIEFWVWLCVGHAAIVAVVVLIAKLDRPLSPSPRLPIAPSSPPPVSSFVHGWYPVALMGLTYKELTYLIPRIHPRDFDSVLAAIDHRIFGVHPTVWLEQFTWPPLTEALQLTYSTYYFLPLVLGVVLWKTDSLERFHFFVFVVVVGFYVSYLGYIAVPAIGPRFLPSISEAQTTIAGLSGGFCRSAPGSFFPPSIFGITMWSTSSRAWWSHSRSSRSRDLSLTGLRRERVSLHKRSRSRRCIDLMSAL